MAACPISGFPPFNPVAARLAALLAKAPQHKIYLLLFKIMAAGTGGQKTTTAAHLTAGREKADSLAGKYHIRKYEERDYEMVLAFYIQGIREHIPRAVWKSFSRPQLHLALLAVFLLTYLCWASVITSLAVVSLLLTAGALHMKRLWDEYLHHALTTDMMDIRRTYLEPKDCCFWVVDTGEEVVGMVAVIPPSWWNNAQELIRLSVKKEHRRQGLSKALVKTVIRFSEEHGYQEVVLGTSMVQHAAHRVYESMGFHKKYLSSF
ncbi:PREDICTED: probable N-acetyltransferase CML3 isoform X2 [Thamnophis sirtalis]|uniref:Probable N-acetyltransferase CML3 isoform X2 n=1 Tax=Thamnophis sirtalis TaxID=35019 RepID=A0A6I9YZG3_9SAUR|nr:PREDICTED: probable N-acetyltransferase CML3 isoform X2 [Thamnophis sirtalis]